MTLNTFLVMLLICSTFTGLFTEAAKKLLDEYGKHYGSNTLASIMSVIVSAAVSVIYAILFDVPVSAELIACVIVLIALSWLCSMVGYDKVMQAIAQINGKKVE